MAQPRPSYGLDAPLVVRNLLLISVLPAIGIGLSFLIESSLWFWISLLYFSLTFLSLFGPACWVVYSSLVLKPRWVRQMVDRLQLKGDEVLLDVGCGRGLLLLEAARRLPSGKACGIDLWSTKDQSGNCLAETEANARACGVAHRVELRTGDMRTLPYPDGLFDVVVSSLAIHNIPEEAGRHQAIAEILRVLKPKGQLLLFDIHYGKQYEAFLRGTNLVDAICSTRNGAYCPQVWYLTGKKK
ncbi:MAG: class I SAM-dependent methyltransferase [Chlamydiia bacterium]